MNYNRIYHSIISKRRAAAIEVGYSEIHHIIPRSLGGSDDKDNLVRLSAREHFICHLLLTKIYSEKYDNIKMVRAFIMMLCSSSDQSRYFGSRSYERLKAQYSQIMSEKQTGSGNSQYGTRWVSDPESGESVKVNKFAPLPEKWVEGRNKTFQVCQNCNTKFIKSHISKTCSKVCEKELKSKLKSKYWVVARVGELGRAVTP